MAAEKEIVAKLKLDSKSFGANLKASRDNLLKFSAAAAGIGVAVGAIALSTANFQDEIIKTARSVGASAEEFSQLSFAAELSGLKTEELAKNLLKLQKPVGLAEKTLKKLGISVKTSTGEFRTSTDLLGELADKFKELPNRAARASAAFDIFGSKGTKMVNLLVAGSEGLKDFAKEAEQLGIIVTEKAGVSAEKFNDDLARLSKSFRGLTNSIGESIIEFTNQSGILTRLALIVQKIRIFFDNLDEGTKEIILTVVAIVVALGTLAGILAVIITIGPAVAAAFSLMLGPLGLVILAVGGLIALFISLENPTEKLIRNITKSNKVLDKNVQVLEKFQNVSKKAQKESVALANSTEKLAEQALIAGRSEEFLAANLVERVRISKEIRKENKKRLEDQLALAIAAKSAVLASDIFQEAQKGGLITSKELQTALEGNTSIVGALASGFKGAGEQLKQILLVQLSSTTSQVNDLTKALKDLGPIGKTVSKIKIDLGAGKAKTAMSSLTDFLLDDLTKAIQKVEKDAAAFVESSRKVTESSLQQLSEARAAQAKKERLINNLISQRKKIIEDVFKTELQLTIEGLEARQRGAEKAAKQIAGTEAERIRIVARLQEKTDREIFKARTKAFAAFVDDILEKANTFTSGFRQINQNIVDGFEDQQDEINRSFDITEARFQKFIEAQLKLTQETETARIDALRESLDQQIRDLQDAEAAKVAVIERGANERLLLLNEEFQAQKELLEQQFQATLEAEQKGFELKREFLIAISIDKEQAMLAEKILENDFNQLIKNLEQQQVQDLNDLAKSFRDQQSADTKQQNDAIKELTDMSTSDIGALVKARNEALAVAEEEKNAKLEALEKQRNDTQEALARERALKLFEAEKAGFEAGKAVKIADTIAAGISGAAQAFASLSAIPFVGPFLGAIAAAGILTATAQSATKIAAQQVQKPVELSLQAGGIIGGNRTHAQGGVTAELESGEAVIDRIRTQRLLAALDSGTVTNNRSVTVVFERGSISNEGGQLDESFMDKLGNSIAQRLERESVIIT